MEQAGVAGRAGGRSPAGMQRLPHRAPGFGLVSPFGTCPAFSVSITTPEMMHVWVVDSPAGAFAEGLAKEWVVTYHASHGQPYSR
jgi:hypothetical protein